MDENLLSPAALSQHLDILREQGMVTTRRQGQTIYYALNEVPALDIIDVLYSTYCKARKARRTDKKR